jgi:hypothetical protein
MILHRYAIGTAVVSLSICVSAPAAAESSQSQTSRQGAFAGAAVQLSLGGRSAARPVARLFVGQAQTSWTAEGRREFRTASGLEFGFTRAGRPQAYFGGEPVEQLGQRLGAGPGLATGLIIAGVAAAGAATIAIASSSGKRDTKPGPCPPGVEVCIQ